MFDHGVRERPRKPPHDEHDEHDDEPGAGRDGRRNGDDDEQAPGQQPGGGAEEDDWADNWPDDWPGEEDLDDEPGRSADAEGVQPFPQEALLQVSGHLGQRTASR